jgi:putative ABC transport system substrate-binding protein
MKRRKFIKLIGGAVSAWPLAARAQQPSIPVVGWLGATAPGPFAPSAEAFRLGLSETGFVDGRTVKIEYRWAENRYEQLPALAADLVSRKVDAIMASGGSVSALAAKTATATIPIVFSFGADPTKVGLVSSLARPEGSSTRAALPPTLWFWRRRRQRMQLGDGCRFCGRVMITRSTRPSLASWSKVPAG